MTFLRTVGTGVSGTRGDGLDEPGDLKFDPITGNLYVADVFNSEIDVYDPNTGEFITSFGSFSGQSDLATSSSDLAELILMPKATFTLLISVATYHQHL